MPFDHLPTMLPFLARRRAICGLVYRSTRLPSYSTSRVALNQLPGGDVPPPPPPSTEPPAAAHVVDGPVDELLYKFPMTRTIRIMMGVTGVNGVVWSSFIFNYFLFKGQMFQGIDLGGDPFWGFFGTAMTGLFLYFTRHFAHNSVYQCYLTADGARLGFQVHNMFGLPGRKFEVPMKMVKLMDKTFNKSQIYEEKRTSFIFNTSLTPVKVEGINGNLLLDQVGLREHSAKLVDILMDPAAFTEGNTKEKRLDWKKTQRPSSKRGK